jgi:hypothetical protein
MILWSNKKCLVGPRAAFDVVNPRTLELETAKEILRELFDIRDNEVVFGNGCEKLTLPPDC